MHSPPSRGLLLPTIMLLGLLISGCTTTSQGQPAPGQHDTTPDPTGNATSNSREKAPTLEAEPLRVPEGSPCKLLTQQQWDNSIYAPFKPENHPAPGGRTCLRQKLEANNSIAIRIQKSRNGLQALYNNDYKFEVFEPYDIAGYPSVKAKGLVDGSSCFVTILLTPKTIGSVTAETSTPSKRSTICQPAKKYAGLVVKNLKVTG